MGKKQNDAFLFNGLENSKFPKMGSCLILFEFKPNYQNFGPESRGTGDFLKILKKSEM